MVKIFNKVIEKIAADWNLSLYGENFDANLFVIVIVSWGDDLEEVAKRLKIIVSVLIYVSAMGYSLL